MTHGARIGHVLALAAFAGAAAGPARAQERSWALTNARIETVTRGTIDRGTILIRDGLIVAAGANVAVPAGYRTLDLAGKTVTPGFIDLTSTLGLPAPSGPAGRGPGGGGGGGGPGAGPRPGSDDPPPGLDPSAEVLSSLHPSAADLKAARDAGITAVLVAPARGAFRGLSALIPTRDSFDIKTTIKSPVAQHLGYQGAGFGAYPGSLMGVVAFERQTLYDAQRQALLKARYAANPQGMERPALDPGLDALIPVVDGKMPIFVDARREAEIRRASRLAAEFNLRMTVVGAVEGWQALDALRGHGVAVAVNFPAAAEVTGWSYRGSRRHPLADSADAARDAARLIEGNAAALHRAGIPFALTSGGTRGADFVANVRKTIAAGLPAGAALAAVTIRAAELAGVASSLGSIEPGKIANLVVANRSPLADSAVVSLVFVDGEAYPVDPPAATGGARGRGGRGGGSGTAARTASGQWTLTMNGPQGTQDQTLDLAVDGAAVSGTLTTQFGALPIEGRLDGTALSWSASVSRNGQAFELTYSATLDGDRMTGTVTAGTFGSFPFSGVKRP